MIRWRRFAIDRKRQIIISFGAALGLCCALPLLMPLGARTYVITDGARVVTYTTFATDPVQVLGEAGLTLRERDSFQAGGSDIEIRRSQRIRVSYHGQEHILTSTGETVESLLNRSGLTPGEGDRVSCNLRARTRDGMELRVDSLVTREETWSAAIPHGTTFCYDSSLPQGTRQVLIPGQDGELLRTGQVSYLNGQESGRKVLSETMTASPVEEIIAIGTGQEKTSPHPGDMPEIGDGYIKLPTGELLHYYKTATVRATAYTHTDAGCDFITYTGTRVRIGTVAVDPRFIPYGTRMFIVSEDGCYIYGLSTAEDCGGAIKRDRVDLYFPTYEECIQFGRRKCTVYFLG